MVGGDGLLKGNQKGGELPGDHCCFIDESEVKD